MGLHPQVTSLLRAMAEDGAPPPADLAAERQEYLDSARQAIDEQFGSLDAYLHDAGISDSDVDRLRGALLA